MATPLTGRSGTVKADAAVIASIENWKCTPAGEIKTYHVSGGSGGQYVLDGYDDWSGEYTALGYLPAVLPTTAFAFIGSIDETNGVAGNAMCNRCVINFPIEDGGYITHTTSFESNGPLTIGAAAAADSSVPDAKKADQVTVELGTVVTSPVYAAETDVRSVTVTLSASNPSYRSNDTANQTKRIVGNKMYELSYDVYNDAGLPANVPQKGDIKQIKVTCNTDNTLDEWWDFKWMICTGLSEIKAGDDPEEIIGATCNWTMCGAADVDADGTMVQGAMKTPAQSPVTLWP